MFEKCLFFPFCLKPCGFSRPGDFFDTIRTRAQGAQGKRGKRKNTEYPIWHKSRKAAGFFTQASRRRSLAAVTASRNFVTKNTRAREPRADRRENPHARAQRFPDSKEIVLLFGMAVKWKPQ